MHYRLKQESKNLWFTVILDKLRGVAIGTMQSLGFNLNGNVFNFIKRLLHISDKVS